MTLPVQTTGLKEVSRNNAAFRLSNSDNSDSGSQKRSNEIWLHDPLFFCNIKNPSLQLLPYNPKLEVRFRRADVNVKSIPSKELLFSSVFRSNVARKQFNHGKAKWV